MDNSILEHLEEICKPDSTTHRDILMSQLSTGVLDKTAAILERAVKEPARAGLDFKSEGYKRARSLKAVFTNHHLRADTSYLDEMDILLIADIYSKSDSPRWRDIFVEEVTGIFTMKEVFGAIGD